MIIYHTKANFVDSLYSTSLYSSVAVTEISASVIFTWLYQRMYEDEM